MDRFEFLCILIGGLIIAIRGPLLIAPEATLRFYGRMVASNARVRAIGLAIGLLGIALVTLPYDGRSAEGLLRTLGWITAAATLWLLAAPGSYRRLAQAVIEYFQSSGDEAVARIVGFVAVAIGLALVYAGIEGV